MNTKTNVNTKKIASLLIALLMVFNVGAITVFAGNGEGTGGGNHEAELTLQAVRYSTGTAYANLNTAELPTGTTSISGYIRFDRGMTTYSSGNFTEITLVDDSDNTYALNLQQASSNISDGLETYDKKYIYTFSASNLTAGEYTLTLGEGIRANNGQYLTSSPIYIVFSVA